MKCFSFAYPRRSLPKACQAGLNCHAGLFYFFLRGSHAEPVVSRKYITVERRPDTVLQVAMMTGEDKCLERASTGVNLGGVFLNQYIANYYGEGGKVVDIITSGPQVVCFIVGGIFDEQ